MPIREALLALCAVALTGLLVAAASLGPAWAVAAAAAAAFVLVLLVVGARRTGVALLALGFATAPMYRGIEGVVGEFATPTDLLLVLGAFLMVPELARQRLVLPTVYVVGVGGVAAMGIAASAISPAPVANFFYLAQWLFYLGLLPILIAWWRPAIRTVAWLLWAYLAGHMVSTAYALVEGPLVNDRYDGLTHHANAFALAGMMSVAIILFLFAHHRDSRTRFLLLVIGLVSVASIAMSGSRAATAVAAVLILLVPIVERSAVTGFVFALLGALAVLALPIVVDISGEGTAISRLAGDSTASTADSIRTDALSAGWERFLGSPILGTGFVDVTLFHNVYLEVAVAVGAVGLVFYLAVLFILARPLFSTHPYRRLSYLAWALIGVAPALPGIWDRTIWVPVSVAILAARPLASSAERSATTGADARTAPAGVGN